MMLMLFFLNMRARVSECVSLIIFIFWLYLVNDPILCPFVKKKKKKTVKEWKEDAERFVSLCCDLGCSLASDKRDMRREKKLRWVHSKA